MATAQKVIVRFNITTKSSDNKNVILNICVSNNIRVSKIIEKNNFFLVIFSSVEDADKVFDEKILILFVSSNIEPSMPHELRARRSVIIKKLDDLICSASDRDIQQSIEQHNPGVIVRELRKFKDARGMKVTFTTAVMADKVLVGGIKILRLFIQGTDIHRDNYVNILTCYVCYDIEKHTSSNCPALKNDCNYKACSLCSSNEHTWKSCNNPTRRCINCDAEHSSLSNSCPVRQQVLRNKRASPQMSKINSYASAAASGNSSNLPHFFDNSTASKTMTCIMLSVMKSHSSQEEFETTLNNLLKQNKLPTISIGNYVPPRPNEIFHSVEPQQPPTNMSPNTPTVTQSPPISPLPPPEEPPAITCSSSGRASRRQEPHSARSPPTYDIRKMKIYRNYLAIRNGEELAESIAKGTAIVIDEFGRIPSSDVIADVCLNFSNVRNQITSLKVEELKKLRESTPA